MPLVKYERLARRNVDDDRHAIPLALVIEDDEAIGNLLDEVLSTEGASVVRAVDAESGLQLARERRPDVILLDHYLPGGTGQSLLERLRCEAETRRIPVIMLSAAPRDLAPVPAPDALVTKPFDLSTLLSEIERFVPLTHVLM
ncbi:MAG: response regulator [Chloroflexi bacterium]|nr:response regulator [Chloroflexota bacterium]